MSFQSTTRLVALVMIFALCLCTVAVAQGQQRYEERFARTVPLGANGMVSLKNIAGDIEVNTWNRSEVQIEALKVSTAPTAEEAKQNADAVTIEVEQSASGVFIETEYPQSSRGSRKMNVSVEFVLTVPSRAETEIGSVSGSIQAVGLGAKSRLSSVSGAVQAQKIEGTVEAKSVSGSVTISETHDAATCESVSGSVTVSHVGGATKAKSVSGDVKVTMSQGSVEAEAMSGDIQIVEPSGAAFQLAASTFSGRIRNDFQIQETEVGEHELSGTVNGGGKRVRAKSFSGDVHVTRQ